MDLDELVEKVAGEDRRDPYKELAKNPSSLVSATPSSSLNGLFPARLSGVFIRSKGFRGAWAALPRPIWI